MLKVDSLSKFSNFFLPHHDTSSSSAFFPYILPDSGYNYSQSQNYYQFDSLRHKPIVVENSQLFKADDTKTEFAQLRPAMPEKWLFYIILFLAAIVVFVKSFFARFFIELWKSYFNLNNAMQMMRQQDISFSVPGLLLAINFYVAFAILLFLHLHRQKVQISFNELFLIPILMIGIIGFVICRMTIYRLAVNLFNQKNDLETLSYLDLMQLEFAGIIFVPLNLVLAFGSPSIINFLWIGCYILLSGMTIYRIVIAWRIGGNIMFANFFHFILYICTVEVAPILILIKLVQQLSILK